MTDPLLVGLDMGSTNVKAAVFTPAGDCLALASTPSATHYPRPTWAYYEPAELWREAVTVLREATAQIDDPARIAGVAVASIGETGVPLDAAGTPTYHAIAWFDRRTLPEAEWLAAHIGEDTLFASSGLALEPIFTLCKLRWIMRNEPAAWARARHWLHVADYIAYRLSGAMATDHSLASRTLMLDLHRGEWNEEIIRAAGIAPEILAPAVPSGTPIGTVTPDAAEATGLPAGCVVAAGGHDHVCGALAAGVIDPGTVLDSMGTAEALFLTLDRPVRDPQLGKQGYAQGAHVVPGRVYALGGLYTSGASVEWYRDLIGRDRPFPDLLADASAVPPGSLGVTFLPHLRLASPPHADPRARGAFIGLTTDTTRAAITRALFEGLAFEARATLEPLLAYAGIDRLTGATLIGGSTRNDLFVQIKASTLDAALHVLDVEEAAALGAAMLAGVGAGIYPDAPSAARAVRPSPRTVTPDPGHVARYDALYRRVYAPLYGALRDLNHQIHDLWDQP